MYTIPQAFNNKITSKVIHGRKTILSAINPKPCVDWVFIFTFTYICMVQTQQFSVCFLPLKKLKGQLLTILYGFTWHTQDFNSWVQEGVKLVFIQLT
jgi:hypothetical protein